MNYYVYNSVKRNDKQGVDATSQAVHPVVRTHEETKRKALYVNRLMSVRIEGMPEAESDALLNFLFDHSEKPEFVYTPRLEGGDLIVWDNRCSSHARTDFPVRPAPAVVAHHREGQRAGRIDTCARSNSGDSQRRSCKMKTLVVEHTAPFQALPELVADAEGLFATRGHQDRMGQHQRRRRPQRAHRRDSARRDSIRTAATAVCSNRARPTCTTPANGATTAACRTPA